MYKITALEYKLNKLAMDIEWSIEYRDEKIDPECLGEIRFWSERIDNLRAQYRVVWRRLVQLQSIVDHNLEVVANYQL